MGGGSALNIFNFSASGLPKQALRSKRLWLAVVTFGTMGAARGVDEGLISGVFNTNAFKVPLGLDQLSPDELASVKGNVSSMVQLGSILGALLAFLACDYLGRVWATRELCFLWIAGIAIFMGNNGSLAVVYFGRFLAGVGIGQTVVVAPVYLSEIAPFQIRGLCTCVFTGAVYLGIVLAYFANYGAQVHMGSEYPNAARWEVPTSVHLMFAFVILILTLTAIESPRYLVSRGRREEALKSLCVLRNLPAGDPYVTRELSGIEAQYEEEMEARVGMKGVFKEIFAVRSNYYRLGLTNLAQVLCNFSGGGTITIYAPDLFAIVGVTGQNEALLSTAIFGIVKLAASIICALFLVDYLGRKRSLVIGIVLQTIAAFYIAIFLNVVPIAQDPDFVATPAQSRASEAAIAMIYISGAGWALGWNSGQYLLSSELFPLRIRAVCSSVTMAMHFICQYAVTKALPHMLLPADEQGITPHGSFYFFAAVGVIGAVWVWLFVPEAAGRSLESIDKLFDLPWYRIGLYGKAYAEQYDREAELRAGASSETLEKDGHVAVCRETS